MRKLLPFWCWLLVAATWIQPAGCGNGAAAQSTTISLLPKKKKGVTRAVVVGISNYQDEGIKDLQFAHRDARIFAEFLKSNAGGALSNQQIKLLLNQDATIAALQSALEWLVQNTAPEDRAILYFSGHGDVETVDEKEKGYLLAYDTPKNNYRLNALDLQDLNTHVIGALSRMGARAIVITDACHSGALAGEAIGGREIAATELMRRFASEVRLMSCQPYELSLESTRWDGGRGAFSYYLVNGLMGEADENLDEQVDLFELDMYLQNKVREATVKKQHPEIFGGRKEESLFRVDSATMAGLSTQARREIQQDFETEFLSKVATPEGVANYLRFGDALKQGKLFSPREGSALFYYDALIADTLFRPLRGVMDERLTVALMDSAQQAINAYLKTDPHELAQRERYDAKYARFAEYLRKAAEILPPKDARYRETRAKQYYFEGLALRMRGQQHGDSASLYQQALEKQQAALELENRAAYIHNELGWLQLELGDIESGLASLQTAAALSPTWAIPYNNLAIGYDAKAEPEEAKRFYRKAIALKPDLASAYANMGILYAAAQPDSAELMYRKALALAPSGKDNYFNLGLLLSLQDGREKEAESCFRQALQLDPQYPEAWFELGNLYSTRAPSDSAETMYHKAIALNKTYATAYLNLGMLYYKKGNTPEAQKMFLDAIRSDSMLAGAYGSLAATYQNQWQNSLALLQSAPLDTFNRIQAFKRGAAVLKPEAFDQFLDAFLITCFPDPDIWLKQYLRCIYFISQKQPAKALDHLEKALEKARMQGKLPVAEPWIAGDPDLNSIRNARRFSEILKKYYP